MNVVLIIPTGIGCEIGGHSGDAGPVAKLIGACCDTLFLHPNVVNAADINEMPHNAFYVEGSILDRFLWGEIYLKPVYYNKILVVSNKPIPNELVNAVSAARVTMGARIDILELNRPLDLTATFRKDGRADGIVIGHEELIEQVADIDFDALAISSPIVVPKEVALNYFKNGGVNPWGGVEAKASRLIATALNKPVAHAPQGDTLETFNEIVDPRASAEMVSIAYIHSVLKGLHKAPKIDLDNGFSVDDVSCLISPWCFGNPHKACMEAGIPIIIVRENRTIYSDTLTFEDITIVENYLEAAAMIISMKIGIDPKMVRRPLPTFPFIGAVMASGSPTWWNKKFGKA